MRLIDELRKNGASHFVQKHDPRFEELQELREDALRAKRDYDRLCADRPDKKLRYAEQLKDTEWVIERAIQDLME